jgi:hypothetical protein
LADRITREQCLAKLTEYFKFILAKIKKITYISLCWKNAPVAELADAQRSGRCMGNHVQVRILFGACLAVKHQCLAAFCFSCLSFYQLTMKGEIF